ncbi:hypothetical protein BYT27DRAFT_7032464, partial [Phlegmacium glaucopus]
FEQRTHACKHVLDRMSRQERAVFDAKVEARKREGNPPDRQWVRAEKYGNEMVRKWADERWLDMGMITVVFTVHTDTQGHTVVDCHESIAKRMGFKGQSFKNRYHDNVIAMNRLLLDFVKLIK